MWTGHIYRGKELEEDRKERKKERKKKKQEERMTKSNDLMTKHKHEFQRHEKVLNNSLLLTLAHILVYNKENSVESVKNSVIYIELISVTSICVIGFACSILSKFLHLHLQP